LSYRRAIVVSLSNSLRKMMTQVTDESRDNIAPQRSPGYLMAPFGWAAKPLAAMLEADPSLYPALFTLSRRRMHLIGLALAHWPCEIDAQLAGTLIGGVPDAVLGATLGRRPTGLKRALFILLTAVRCTMNLHYAAYR
jgi:hypothetical protein